MNEEETIYENESAGGDGEERFEMTPEQATSAGGPQGPGTFNRKRVLVALCISFAVVIGGGLILNTAKGPKKAPSAEEEVSAAGSTPAEFLSSLQNRAAAANRREAQAQAQAQAPAEGPPAQAAQGAPEPRLPPASMNRQPAAEPAGSPPPAPAQNRQAPPSSSGQQAQEPAHFRSPLVPQVQGSLFAGGAGIPAQNRAAAANPAPSFPAQNPAGASAYGQARVSDYGLQNAQENKMEFFGPSPDGPAPDGRYLGDGSIWTGTIIPGILLTAVNTDLPGNVLARVTQNVYDSRTGRFLLIPQGTLLIARYNSSVSYAQHRVQIVWDAMIRPDGFQVNLSGAGGVDRLGMSGQQAEFHENWFEYLKAAGIVTLFSTANARMTEASAKYATEASAANIAEANSQLVNRLGGSLAERAMNIQPTLTVENGTPINIMLNQTLYLPPVPDYPAVQKYILE